MRTKIDLKIPAIYGNLPGRDLSSVAGAEIKIKPGRG